MLLEVVTFLTITPLFVPVVSLAAFVSLLFLHLEFLLYSSALVDLKSNILTNMCFILQTSFDMILICLFFGIKCKSPVDYEM